MKSKNLFSKGTLFLATLLLLIISISCAKDPVEPEPEFTYAGDYTGFWNTSVSNRNPILNEVSAIFTEPDENIFVGTFYHSKNWTTFCGEFDGEISFKVEGDSLKNLIFNQSCNSFFACAGTFAGEGKVNEDGNLAFKISGPDCFGSHVGTLLLKKVQQ